MATGTCRLASRCTTAKHGSIAQHSGDEIDRGKKEKRIPYVRERNHIDESAGRNTHTDSAVDLPDNYPIGTCAT
jgi:hypothetical protein